MRIPFSVLIFKAKRAAFVICLAFLDFGFPNVNEYSNKPFPYLFNVLI